MICLTHIPKTGGTTFRNILINNYSWRHVDFPNLPKKIIRSEDFPLNSKVLKQIKSLSGHRLRYSDDIRMLFPEFRFIVFFREPISRIISLFFHIQRYEQPELKFRTWVEENYTTPMLSNSQTIFIAGKPDVDCAKAILDKKYFFSGCMEKFDHSLLILKRMIGDDFDVRYVRKNIAKRNKNDILKDADNQDVLQTLYKYNELDIHLYDYVKESMFSRYQQQYGEVTDDDVDRFRMMNKTFHPSLVRKNSFRLVKYLFFENMFRIRS